MSRKRFIEFDSCVNIPFLRGQILSEGDQDQGLQGSLMPMSFSADDSIGFVYGEGGASPFEISEIAKQLEKAVHFRRFRLRTEIWKRIGYNFFRKEVDGKVSL